MKTKGFLKEETLPDHYEFGSGKLTKRFGATALRPDGQWGEYLPPEEKQQKKFETYACTVYAALNAWEIVANLLRKKKLIGEGDFPKDCSERYNAILAKITPPGGFPHKSAETVRKFGVLHENLLPFSDSIYSWEYYYTPDPMDENLIKMAKQYLNKVDLQHEWVFNNEQVDYKKMEDALKRGVLCASVYGWKEKNGVYYKDPGDQDTHWTVIYGYTDKHWLCFDSYPPFKKKIARDTKFWCAKLYTMSKKKLSDWDRFLVDFQKFVDDLGAYVKLSK